MKITCEWHGNQLHVNLKCRGGIHFYEEGNEWWWWVYQDPGVEYARGECDSEAAARAKCIAATKRYYAECRKSLEKVVGLPPLRWRKMRQDEDAWCATEYRLFCGSRAIASAEAFDTGWAVDAFNPVVGYRSTGPDWRHKQTLLEAKITGIDMSIAEHEKLNPPDDAMVAALREYRERLEKRNA